MQKQNFKKKQFKTIKNNAKLKNADGGANMVDQVTRNVIFKIIFVTNELKAYLYCSITKEERDVLWEKRFYLTWIPDALPILLKEVPSWDWGSLMAVYPVVNEWDQIPPPQALILLLPKYATIYAPMLHFNTQTPIFLIFIKEISIQSGLNMWISYKRG